MGAEISLMSKKWTFRLALALPLVIGAVLLLRIPSFHSLPHPAKDFEQAKVLFENLRRTESILPLSPEGASRMLAHGTKTPRAFVLLHGITNCPEQFLSLARILHAQGANVIIPRARYAGFADVLNSVQGNQSGQDLLDQASVGLDIAAGLGDRVSLVCLSGSAVAGTWMTQHRDGVDEMLLLAPFFSLDGVPLPLNDAVAAVLSVIPNFYLWWDSEKKETRPGPKYAYPRFGTRCIASTMQVSRNVRKNLFELPMRIRKIHFLITATDDATNNPLTKKIAATLSKSNPTSVTIEEFPAKLKIPHDMVDPSQPNANTEIVYKKILELLDMNGPSKAD